MRDQHEKYGEDQEEWMQQTVKWWNDDEFLQRLQVGFKMLLSEGSVKPVGNILKISRKIFMKL